MTGHTYAFTGLSSLLVLTKGDNSIMKATIFKGLVAAILAASLATKADTQQWFVTRGGVKNTEIRINYGTPSNNPQYAALHITSSYLRMNYGPGSGWGTSIVTMPCYWSGGIYYQGTAIDVSWLVDGDDLVLMIAGNLGPPPGPLTVVETVRFLPPARGSFLATLSATVTGTVELDPRPGEAFKPVFLSSMHDSDTVWDGSVAFADEQIYAFPPSQWVIAPQDEVYAATFGILGGTSDWNPNAPSVTIMFDQPYQIAGWVTRDKNPNDDNVGVWAASDSVLPCWSYTILVNGTD
jgi:hypothetical protein